MDQKELYEAVKTHSKKLRDVRREVQKGIVGQEEAIDSLIKCFVCNGHVLIDGVPGIAKTLLVLLLTRTIKDAKFQRIQFTPDLLPTDITGTTVYEEEKGFYIVKGPVFANILVGDEINRTPPKVQSGMLQAMQERQVTIGRETFDLPQPFFVLATQNPLETQGVYPLPEAQIDRFLFKIIMTCTSKKDELSILDRNVEVMKIEDFNIRPILDISTVLEIQGLIKDIHMSEEIKKYIVSIVNATRRPDDYYIRAGSYILLGASPRATIYLSLTAKATALMNSRTYVIPEDVRDIAHNVLRHRILLNYEGKAKGVKTDEIINEIIKKVPVF